MNGGRTTDADVARAGIIQTMTTTSYDGLLLLLLGMRG